MASNDVDGWRGRVDVPAAPRRVECRLGSTLVRTDGGPNRRTIFPPGLAGDARMSTWLTADSDAFLGLESMR